ncbi:transcriptional regulator [Terriglobus albidus]|uniref:Transcriptional regulator n=1 Tax=Terriglobus albidus TaxID=1592106 RepID=A0A5B9EGI4_9BACT|nr:transcriptional regulator [Terriglobus albidus]QEE30694.1 transcriptional regulator [Terriglobus albidus]
MKENFRRLRAQQIDRMVQPLRSVSLPRPPRGWIRALREAMGVSSSELARRLKANRSLASQQEKAEVGDRITLRSLRACANALDCDLVYAFVPRGATIEETLAARAHAAASLTVRRVEHSMALEDQASGNVELAIEAQTRRVKHSGPSR